MNINDLSTQLLYTTVPIVAYSDNSNNKTGTGFVFSVKHSDDVSIPLVIVDYNLVKDARTVQLEFHNEKDGEPDTKTSIIRFDGKYVCDCKISIFGLVAIPIAGALNNLQKKGIALFFKSVDSTLIPEVNSIEELSAIEDIVVIGYPTFLFDNVNRIPVIRRGITATPIWNDYKGNSAFMIDIGAQLGLSGSPVFIYNNGTFPIKNGIAVGNRLLFVGILTQYNEDNNKSSELGLVIKSQAFLGSIDSFIKTLLNE